MAVLGLATMSSGLVMLNASPAAANGNNGSVKVHGIDIAGPANNPKLPCSFAIEWAGFDGTTVNATVDFTMVNPTANPSKGYGLTSLGGAASVTFSGTGHTESYTPVFTGTPKASGYHVSIHVDTEASGGQSINKSKTFWVAACNAPPTVSTTAVDPTVVQSTQCGVQGSYTVPSTAGVDYYLDGTLLTSGVHSGPASGTMTAEAQPNYMLTNEDWSFALDLKPAADCNVTTVTPVDPTVTQPKCTASGPTPLVVTPATTPAGVSYTYDAATKTVTATADPTHKFASQLPSGWVRVDDHTATYTVTLVPADCPVDTSVVQPTAPTVTQPQCTGPGTSSKLLVVLASTPAGVSYTYDAATKTVTATADPTHKFTSPLPSGWAWVNDHTATYQVTEKSAGDCLVDVSASAPSASAPTCTAPGHLVLPSTEGDGYHWTGQTADTPGDHTVTAVADAGYHLVGQSTWTVHVKAANEGLDCNGVVSPDAPTVTQPACTGPGTQSAPVVTLPGGPEGVEYGYDSATQTVTATATGAHKFAATLPAGWQRVSDTVATYAVHVVSPGDCLVEVSPVYPTVTPATCKKAGSLVTPTQPAGVLVTSTGTAPGDVTFSFAPATGYVFPAGTVTELTLTVAPKKTGTACGDVLGTQTARPKPTHHTQGTGHRPPTVLGTQAGVPTAVEAGLASWPGERGAASTRDGLAQLLLGGGLLLLIAAGSLGLGLRSRGGHEF